MSIDKKRITAEPTEVLEDIPLDENNPEKFTRDGASMEKKSKQDLVQFLKKSLDVFAWSHEDTLRGIGVILQSPEGDKLEYAARLQYHTTNNETEYKALLKGLELAKSLGAESVVVKGDFQLENVEADALAKVASAGGVMDECDKVQYMLSIDLLEIHQIGGGENWMTPVVVYLKDGRLLEDKDEARKLRVRAAKYVLIDEVLYKRGFSQPYLRCLASDESNYLLREIHEKACKNHSGARSLVHKVVRAGYYWPTIQANAKAYVKVCDQCQRFSNIPKQPLEYLTPMMAPWPFAQWELDILGPFHLGTRQIKYLVVGIDYFIKWVEAEPLAKITKQNVKNFVWKNIVCRMTVKTPIGETLFKLAYGSEAVIPAEVHIANHRVMKYQEKENEEQLRLDLDLIDELRIDAEQRTARYKNLMTRQYDAMVKPKHFNIGDLVLTRVSLATKNPAHGKLGPNWEGPYRVIYCKRQGSYYLEALDGRKLEHPWNVEHLRR
ncbi:uncharacterized protein LOC142616282 [Castanea sativa]|uniref:uncharacterized protein LOC142616282 n=1 Tax=Castanea sativa TaxID=21020 RepID=UPI003F64C590